MYTAACNTRVKLQHAVALLGVAHHVKACSKPHFAQHMQHTPGTPYDTQQRPSLIVVSTRTVVIADLTPTQKPGHGDIRRLGYLNCLVASI
jgi:hypothetical protein